MKELRFNTNTVPTYGLAIVLLWVAGMKFTHYEAEAISGLISNNPLISWMYSIMSKPMVSSLIGISEILVALLLLLRPVSEKFSALGGVAASFIFIGTLSFLVTTPGVWEASLGGFPALSVMPGQFLIKDLALLSVAVWTTITSLNSLRGEQDAN